VVRKFATISLKGETKMDFLRNLFGKKESAQPSQEIQKIGDVGRDKLLKICIGIMVDLQLTYMEGVDETPVPDLAKHLMEDENFSENLATGIATATFKAYKISGKNTDKYLPLCLEYFKKL
jgi:hypothetical protein